MAEKTRNEMTLVKTHWQAVRRSLHSAPDSLTYLVKTSFVSVSGKVSTSEVKTKTYGQPSGARACAEDDPPSMVVGKGSLLYTTRMSGDNLCLCSGWAVSFVSASLLAHVCRMVCPWSSELGHLHLMYHMGNV